MLPTRAAGRNASALKYDILSALGAHALDGDKHRQKMVLRIMVLVTTRYNWQSAELSIGRAEIARLWSVDERTVKREMAKLRAMGWLVVKRQGARGRVSEYALGIERILEDSRDRWADVGPDLEHRLSGEDKMPEKVVPLPVKGRVEAPDLSDGSEWTLAKALLHAEDAGLYGSWIAALERGRRAGGRLHLRAPSRFHATYVATHLAGHLLSACQSVDASVDEVVIET